MATPKQNATAKAKPRGRAGGRKPLPNGEARVHVGGRVAPATAAAIEATGLGTGKTIDAWWDELQQARKKRAAKKSPS